MNVAELTEIIHRRDSLLEQRRRYSQLYTASDFAERPLFDRFMIVRRLGDITAEIIAIDTQLQEA